MPARNGTGPTGKGPLTGRGMGNCRQPGTVRSQGLPPAGNMPPGIRGRTGGGGLGRFFGRLFGRGRYGRGR